MRAAEMAVKMEIDAIAFYTEAAAKVKSNVGRKMFLAIADDEKHHLEIIEGFLKDMDIAMKDISPIKNIKSIFEQLKHEMMERVEAAGDEMNAFKIAMDMEREGADFYRKAVSEAASPKEKALFERLIKEEEQHFAVFSNTYSFMKDTGNWFMWEEHGLIDGGTPWA